MRGCARFDWQCRVWPGIVRGYEPDPDLGAIRSRHLRCRTAKGL